MPEIYTTSLFPSDTSLYYRLEGNSTDSKGVANGTDTAITYGSAYGKYGQGALFNGSSSKIAIAQTFGGQSGFSFTCWINKAAVGVGSGLVLYDDDCIMLGNYDGASAFRFRVKNSGGWFDTGAADYPYGTGSWHMATGTFQAAGGANNLKLYLDGVLWQTATTDNAAISAGASSISLGGRTAEYYNGSMDDVAFFTKVLSAVEISALYDHTAGFFQLFN